MKGYYLKFAITLWIWSFFTTSNEKWKVVILDAFEGFYIQKTFARIFKC